MTRDEQRRRVEEAIWDAVEGEHPPLHALSTEARAELRAQADAALDSLEHPPIHANTPREALLMVMAIVSRVKTGGMSMEIRHALTEAATAGLTGREEFLTTDRLGEKLAQAHTILEQLREGADMATLSGEIDEALMLGPDLESMIDRMKYRPVH